MRVANFGRVWFWLLSHAMRHVCMHACAAPPIARSDTLTGWFGDGLVSDTVTMLRYNNTDSPPCLHPPSPSAPPCIHAVFSRKSPCPPSPHRCYSPPPLFLLRRMETRGKRKRTRRGCVEGTGTKLDLATVLRTLFLTNKIYIIVPFLPKKATCVLCLIIQLDYNILFAQYIFT